MFSQITQYISHLPISRLNRQIKELYFASALMDLATAMVLIFEPLYLYSLNWSLIKILWFYAGVYFLYTIALPWGGKIARARGFEHTILYSSPFLVGYYLSLLAIPYHFLFAFLAVILFAIQKVLYWPSYHADFAWYVHEEDRGREISQRLIIQYLMLGIAPALGGVIVAIFGFKILFFVVSFLILLSNAPLFSSREDFQYQSFPYLDAWKNVFKLETLKLNLMVFGRGEELLVLTMWPIFIFILLGDYAALGFIITAATFVTLVVTYLIGRAADRGYTLNILRNGTVIYTFVWLARFIVKNSWGVFIIDSLSRLSKNMIDVPLADKIYERAKNLHLMRSIISMEMILGLAKIISALLAIFILSVSPGNWNALWLAGALWSLLYLLLKQ